MSDQPVTRKMIEVHPAPTSRPGPFGRLKGKVVGAVCSIMGCEDAPAAGVATGGPEKRVPSSEGDDEEPGRGLAPASRSAPLGPPPGRGVSATDLGKVYPSGTEALKDATFHARPGEIVAVVGPNGAGKSTALNIISGLIRPTSGAATVEGVDTDDVRRLATVLGVALQTAGLDPAMTASEHFDVQAALYGVPRVDAEARKRELLETFKLTEYGRRPVSDYSVGLQRRLVVALSLLHDPMVVIMDEPTAGLDPQTKRTVWGLLEKLRDQGRTIMFSTQMLEEADGLADRIYVLVDGRIVAEGTPAEIRKQYGELAIRIRTTVPAAELAELLTPMVADRLRVVDDETVLIEATEAGSDEVERLMARLRHADIPVIELVLARPSLEDAFVELTGSVVREEPAASNGRGLLASLCRCS